ncbi:3'(2'),5'-bisphosphate nucleotidase CysQ [Sulfurovum sp. NBC37-1]|uniref:3'(2'),5'-bisphosphate nucleotidase CysQ n=1 Tax=Sulfurovum sp. (strain NBC37-1) TaxID=387093 RepID=UPI000158795A|nr:3'(2'),5'-bisphosphate nucleotidase CysQ [Sulfurovum sp. NBC37-1]BAF72668.1 3(2),5 -bisphosphate nucleotidase [Sulfurovum sp. NBC37-1]
MLDKIDLKEIEKIALEAGKIIMEIYNRDFSIEYKDDRSPLTEADLASHDVIVKRLEKYGIHVMSEESRTIDYDRRKAWEYYWCIDPIDGTKEFIKKNGEFTINIALIHHNMPVLGVVYAPALNDMYTAKQGQGAFKNGKKMPLQSNSAPSDKISVVASKSHLSDETQAFIDALNAKEIVQVSKGSSLKLCMVAEGKADIYPRLAPTMEWDTAAADAIVRESGRMTYQYENGMPLVYNKMDLLNPWFVVK